MTWNGTYVSKVLQVNHEEQFNYLPFETLVGLALRKNPKRAHLLVSKILGKHIPVNPILLLNCSRVLASQVHDVIEGVTDERTAVLSMYLRKALKGSKKANQQLQYMLDQMTLKTDALVLGYAETATGLGAAVAHMLNAPYIHSTRYPYENANYYGAFEEEHSHATSHHVTPADPNFFKNSKPLILVDDELTTGTTVMNTIASLQEQQKRKHYVIATYLDLRTEEHRKALTFFAKKLKIKVDVVSLYSGTLTTSPNSVDMAEKIFATIPEAIRTYYKSGEVHIHRINLPQLTSGETKTGVSNLKNYELAGNAIADAIVHEINDDRTLVLGVEEEMFLPIMVANELKRAGKKVSFSSTTRSPVFAKADEAYAIQDKIIYRIPEDSEDTNIRFAYNVGNKFDTIVLVVKPEERFNHLDDLISQLKRRTERVIVVKYSTLPNPLTGPEFSSYSADDVKWLLKDLSNVELEMVTEEREEAIQSGGAHYAESLPIEYQPTLEYQELFKSSLNESGDKLAVAVGVVAEKIIKARRSPVLVSLARAGTPVGVLIKRYIKSIYRVELPHYAVSIVRGKGIDYNALNYLAENYHAEDVIFIDGWTGKGAIVKELSAALKKYGEDTGVWFNPDVAVLADPGSCVEIFGTRDDYLIPSACLNSTVSGLISRTVLNDELIGPNDYHGAKFYKEFADNDYSNYFVDFITALFPKVRKEIEEQVKLPVATEPTWAGWASVEEVNIKYGINNINLVKPGVGETTRVLLRRVPWRILIRKDQYDNLAHIRLLAEERGTDIDVVDELPYSCIGLIHPKYTKGATGFDGATTTND